MKLRNLNKFFYSPCFLFLFSFNFQFLLFFAGTFIEPYGEKMYVLWYAISVFFMPLIVLVFTYFNICKVIWINARTNLKSDKETKKSRTVMFHSKLAASLSSAKRRSEKEDDNLNNNNLKSGQMLDQLSNCENKNLRNCNLVTKNQKNLQTQSQTKQSPTALAKAKNQLNEITSLPLNSEMTKDCCWAQNGQTTSQFNSQILNNQINNQTATSSSTVQTNFENITTTNKFTTMKSPSIFASRTAANATKLSKAKIKTIQVT